MATAFDIPQEYSYPAIDLRVALAPGGVFDFGWKSPQVGNLGYRLRVEEVSAGINQHYPRCRLSLNLAGEYDDGDEVMPPLSVAWFNKAVDPDMLLVVYADGKADGDEEDEDTRRFLFTGYPNVQELKFSGLGRSEHASIEFTCTSLLERLNREWSAAVTGRNMKRPQPTPAQTNYVHCPGLPCIFNFRGKPNRHKDLIAVGSASGAVQVPVFTYEGDPQAKYWKYADVLTYLLAAYLWPLGEDYFLQDGNGGSFARPIVEANGDPVAIADPDNQTFAELLSSQADEISCEGLGLVSALQLVCQAAGMGMMQWTLNEGGQPKAKLLFWSLAEGGPWQTAGVGSERQIRASSSDPLLDVDAMKLEKEGVNLSSRKPASVASDVVAADLVSSSTAVVASCRVLGDPDLIEAGFGYQCATKPADIFKPGWRPDATFGDGLSGAGLDAKLLEVRSVERVAYAAMVPSVAAGALWERYVRMGPYFWFWAHVGRLWVLNEAGELTGANYGRSNGGSTAWAASAYNTPYNFHDNAGCPRGGDDGQQDWFARRRRFLRPLSTYGPDKQAVPPKVDASWDGGTTWFEYPGSVQILDDQCGLLLTDNNLADVKCPSNDPLSNPETSGGLSVWEAILRGKFRLAVTATIEGDDRVKGEASSAVAFASFPAHHTQATRDQFKRHWRVGTSRFTLISNYSLGYSFTEIDHTAQAESMARRIVGVEQARMTAGSLVSAWLRVDWLPGDRISGIQPRGIELTGTRGSQANTKRWPQVVEVTWINGEGGQFTRLTIDDQRRSLTRSLQGELS